jgi:hypothetical protein
MEIGWIMGFFFIFVTIIFVAVAVFLPEWVGITGKHAKSILQEHEQESNSFPAGKNGKQNNPHT